MAGYNIINFQKLDTHITFIRIDPIDISVTLKEILTSLFDLSWIGHFDEEYIRDAYKVRAQETIEYITKNIINADLDSVTSNSGEYIVSELARKTVVGHMNYLSIPLAELIKDKVIGNPGFDFYSKTSNNILLFGEAKYNAKQNAYGNSFEQIFRFEKCKQDVSDIIDIDKFCCNNSKNNFSKGHKGFVAAFASKKISTDVLIKNIQQNNHYNELKKFAELICIAVNI